MNQLNQNSVLNFIATCNEFIKGKFLFVGTKIVSIYEDVLLSEPLTELFSQCQEDFNASFEFTKAFIKLPTKAGTFQRPEELHKFLALVYVILEDVKTGELDLDLFLQKYFSGDEQTPPAKKFALEVITPLRDTVAKYFELPFENEAKFELIADEDVEMDFEKQEENDVVAEQKSFEKGDELPVVFDFNFNKVISLSNEIKAMLENIEKIDISAKYDAIFMLTELLNASINADFGGAKAIAIGLYYVSKKIVGLKFFTKQFDVFKALINELLSLFEDA